MDDDKYRGSFGFDSDFFGSERSSHRDIDDKTIEQLFAPAKKNPTPNFVVNIDESAVNDAEYNFEAFTSSSDRRKEMQRKKELYKKFDDLEKDDKRAFRKSFSGSSQASERRSVVSRSSVKRDMSVSRTAENTKQNSDDSSRVRDTVKKPDENTAASYDAQQRKQNGTTYSEPSGVKPVSQGTKEQPKSAAIAGASSYTTVSRNNAVRNTVPQKPAQEKAPNSDNGAEKQVVRLRTRSARAGFKSLLAFIIVVAVITLIATSAAMSAIGDILAISRTEEQVSVQIDEGNTSYNDVVDALHEAGLIKQKLVCNLFGRFRNFDKKKVIDKETGEVTYKDVEYLSGVYYLEPTLGFEGMLNVIRASNGTGAETVRLTFPEGWTITQIFKKLETKGVCAASKLYANLEVVAKQYDFYYDIKSNDARYLGVEGYLFPDTYEFYKEENAVSVLKKLFDNSQVKWTSEYSKKAKSLGMTRDKILIIASIIQKEAANKEQMGDISSVIYNRLNSSTYPSLQCNSTSDYVSNYVKALVDSTYAQIYTNAYNTYKIEGLPPGPICNPGLEAIEAALNPNDTQYYFFLHNNDGKIYLSSTYAQFQADYAQVLKDNR